MLTEIQKEIEKCVAFIPIQKIFSSKNFFVKLIWIVYFLVTTSLCAYFIYMYIAEYLRFKVSSQMYWINRNKLDFPVITLCKYFENNNYTDLANQLYQNISKGDTDVDNSYLIRYESRKLAYRQLIHEIFNHSQQTIPINSFLILCSYGGKNCYNEFENFYDFYHGYCYSFNTARTKYSVQTGSLNGLRLQFYIDETSSINTTFSIENGFKIFINRKIDNLNLFTDGIQLAPGFMTNIALSKYTLIQVPFPYSDCINNLNSLDSYNSILYKKVFSYNNAYDYYNCKLLCFQKYLGSICKCQSLLSRQFFYDNMRECESHDETCALDAWLNFSNNLDIINECECPVKCISVSYTSTNSISDFPTKFYAENILSQFPLMIARFTDKSKMTYENIRKRVIAINVYYDEIKEALIKNEIKMSSFDLFSCIGGILSLFVGINIITFIEFFEILLMALYIK
jgi:hypothetical protein